MKGVPFPNCTEAIGYTRALAILAGLAASATLLVGAGTASARTVIPTTLTHDASTPLGEGRFLNSGRVISPRLTCWLFRPVMLVARYPGDRWRVLDLSFPSFGGRAWATEANLRGAEAAHAVARRATFGRRGKRRVCQKASVRLPVPSDFQ